MGRAAKNLHRNLLKNGSREYLTTPKSEVGKPVTMEGTKNPVNPPTKSIPTGRKNLKQSY